MGPWDTHVPSALGRARVWRLPQPTVTVVIPTYNSSRFILQALESVFAQSVPPDEIAVVDDGSTDDTFDKISPHLPRIRYHRQEHRGAAAARNAAIAFSRGDLIAFLDADDWYLPDHLASLARRMARDPSLGLVACGWRRVNEQGRPMADSEPWRRAPRLDLKTWLLHKPIFPGAMMVRRAWLERVGGFDESLAISSDVDVVLRLALAGCRADWVHEVSVCYRQHGPTLSSDTRLVAAALEGIHTRFFTQPGLTRDVRNLEPSVRSGAATWLAWRALRNGEIDLADAQLRVARSLKRWPALSVAMAWQADFVRFDDHAGGTPVPLHTMWTAFERALAVSPNEWGEIRNALAAWSLAWLPVQGVGQPASLAEVQREGAAEGSDPVQHVKPGMAAMAPPVTTRMVAAWWRSMRLQRNVPVATRNGVTALYLEAMHQARWQRRWGGVLAAMIMAASTAWQPGGWDAWRRFVRAAWESVRARSHNRRPRAARG